MNDHPILGAVLFMIGAALVVFAHNTSNDPSLLLGHIIALNGVLLVILGCRKLERRPVDLNSAPILIYEKRRPA